MTLTIEERPISGLVPYARNSRTHSDAQVAQIAGSIREFGWTNPILIGAEGDIIAGHGRLLAARLLGMSSAPCVVLDGLSVTQRKALVIADNKLALNAGWDDAMLALEIGELAETDFDVSLLGFSDDEMAGLMVDKTDGLTDPDTVPDVPKIPLSVAGDVWVMGEHRLVCGDSTVQTDVDKLMQGERGDLLFTDPPWNVNYGAVKAGNAQGYKPRKILNDHMDEAGWAQFVTGFCASFYAVTKPGALAYVVMSAQEWPAIDKGLREASFHWSSTIIWVKDALVLSRKDYHTQYEPLWYGWNEDGPRIMHVPDRKQSDIWNIPRPRVSILHPTTKPTQLIERALLNSSARGALVVDLFGGSGSTLIACEQQGRRCRLMELDPKYADVIVQRWQDFTGREAIHEDGRKFNDLVREPDAAAA